MHEALADVEDASIGAANNDDRCGRYVAIPTMEGDAMDPRDKKEASKIKIQNGFHSNSKSRDSLLRIGIG